METCCDVICFRDIPTFAVKPIMGLEKLVWLHSDTGLEEWVPVNVEVSTSTFKK